MVDDEMNIDTTCTESVTPAEWRQIILDSVKESGKRMERVEDMLRDDIKEIKADLVDVKRDVAQTREDLQQVRLEAACTKGQMELIDKEQTLNIDQLKTAKDSGTRLGVTIATCLSLVSVFIGKIFGFI